MAKDEHWSEKVIDDIIGAFKIFVISAVLIFVALKIAKDLYPTFPLDNTSSGIVAVILGLFGTYINYVKSKSPLPTESAPPPLEEKKPPKRKRKEK